ncbi:MAG: TRAP transporter small permease subunit [Chloroflexi bacterium]|nr:TRAP transporter small permease subunit [Chloroflexota bacterium]
MHKFISGLHIFVAFFSRHLAAWLVFGMMLMVVTEAGARYFFNNPLMVADEVGGYMLAVTSALGLAYTWQARGHIRVTVIADRIPMRARKWLRLVTVVLAIALTVILILGSYELVAFSAKFGQRSETWLRVPKAWPQSALIVGFVFLLGYQLVHLVKAIKGLGKAGGEVD